MEETKRRGRVGVRVPFKAGVWYTASSVITKSITMLSTPIFTRLLSGEEYALYPIYLSWIGIISALGGVEAIGSAALVGMQKYKENREVLTASAVALQIGILGMICILYFAFYAIFGKLSTLSRQISVMLFFQAAFDGMTNIIILRWRYEYKYKPVFAVNALSAFLSASLAVIITERLSLGGEGRIIALLLVSAVTVGMIFLKTQPGSGGIDKEIVRFLGKRALPLIPQGLCTALLSGADRIMILRYFGASELAKYSVAHSIGVAICFASSAMLLALRPWIFRRLAAGEVARVREAVDRCVPALCVAALAVICIAPEAMRILAPREYSDAVFAIIPTALSVIPSFLCSVMSASIIYYGADARTLLPVISGTLLNIGLNAIFFTFLPYTSAAVSSLLSGIAGLFLWTAVYQKKSNEPLYSIKRYTALFAVTCAAGYAIFLARELPSLRIILLMLVLILPFPLYKNALSMVKEPRNDE